MKIIPAILTDNLDTFQKQIKQMEDVTDLVQIDISDGQFTPFKSLLADDARQVVTSLKYELHLMVKDPSAAIEEWYNIPNVSSVVFHIEAAKIPAAIIEHIKSYGWTAGVALNPETPIDAVEAAAYQADKILFLSVTPGAQGQTFAPAVLEKIKKFKSTHPQVAVSVDGGLHQAELKQLKELGVEEAVVGSEIFAAQDPSKRFLELEALL
jgi:ribulose-phosphate 3-epimerase